ncbi:uncharacterized protein LOC109536244 isoform X2 [Dendroctonus ponderosae]|uniref:uncharacterized protein LOC109536244 isoform X2 n=1 Tax=Dendroctonus ponderosae TaxID=77166 RepID=UPI002035599F|nr:uncharacterized protein LOC109536244 isoform X2 [Dendroctonus ponderosae]KAH1007226.1 hypothetical protein HUJ04_004491 [Dendroctonus ponderosae]KAH1007227.1 hypothetical protein HUJ04_004491 [Dendroctonus ponderosae]
MSNIIPPLLSDTPPPPPDVDEHDEDEFGDFIGTNNVSFDCDDGCSPPGSPLQLPVEPFVFDRMPPEITDFNSNSKPSRVEQIPELDTSKDFHDKRKNAINETSEIPLRSDQLFNALSVNKDAIQLNKTEEIIETNCDKEETFSSQSEIIKLSSEHFKDHPAPSTLAENLPINNPTDLSEPTSSVIANGVDVRSSSSSDISGNTAEVLEGLKPGDQLGDTSSALHQQIPPNSLRFEHPQASAKSTENGLCEASPGSPSPGPEKQNCPQLANDVEAPQSPIKYADSDFEDFQSSALENSQESNTDFFANFDSLPAKPIETPEDDEFCDFVTPQAGKETGAGIPEFANFDSFSCSTDAEDEFGDFATTTIEPESQLDGADGKILLLNETEALEKATQIVQEMFPPLEQPQPDFTFGGLEADDEIFNQIKNITDTHALSYHWTKSASQKLLLKSLNIDSRNIMFGPGWNPAMPRFASSLSVQPLEPIKSEILTPMSIKDLSRSRTAKESATADGSKIGDVPLMKPIAYQFGAHLDAPCLTSTPLSSHIPSPNKELLSWESWLQSLPVKEPSSAPTASTIGDILELKESKCGSIESNKQTPQTDLDVKPAVEVQLNDFDDFVSHLPPVNQTASHGHSIILRETHISNKAPGKSEDTDIVSWLEPTIVTPELIRKERQFVEGEEEFDDFQMIVAESQASQISDTVNSLTVKAVAVLQPHPIVNQESKVVVKCSEEEASGEHKPAVVAVGKVAAAEDEFGEFTFSVPNCANAVKSEPSKAPAALSLLEPLKPSIVKGRNVASISWPDPGVTEDEISRFEALGYARTQQQEPPKEAGAVSKPLSSTKPTSKPTQKVEDEEWSDFVSVQNASPIHKLKVEKERSSTPDLPLSVLNLGTVHPTKQPIPVITPNGLMQTKLSSNMPLNLSNKVPQKNKVYPQTQVQFNHVYQPSIISNQFASQAYGGFNSYQPQASNSLKSSTEDDEWSDFVSHQSTAKPHQPNQFPGWSNSTPHVMQSGSSGQKQVKKAPSSYLGKNTAMSNVSVPDLDFLAPRNRTSHRK